MSARDQFYIGCDTPAKAETWLRTLLAEYKGASEDTRNKWRIACAHRVYILETGMSVSLEAFKRMRSYERKLEAKRVA